MAVFFCEAGYVLEIGLSSGGGRGWRDGVSLLSSWFSERSLNFHPIFHTSMTRLPRTKMGTIGDR